MSSKPGPIQQQKFSIDPSVLDSMDQIESITDRLEPRMNTPYSRNEIESSKRAHDTSSSLSSIESSSNINNNKSPIVPIIKRFRSVVVGLSQSSVSKPRDQIKDPLLSSSPNIGSMDGNSQAADDPRADDLPTW